MYSREIQQFSPRGTGASPAGWTSEGGKGKAMGFRLKAEGKARERIGGTEKAREKRINDINRIYDNVNSLFVFFGFSALSEQREALRLRSALARTREGSDGSGATHD